MKAIVLYGMLATACMTSGYKRDTNTAERELESRGVERPICEWRVPPGERDVKTPEIHCMGREGDEYICVTSGNRANCH